MSDFKSAVFRVVEKTEAQCCIGTAFSISASSLLTCHHVVADVDAELLSVQNCQGQTWSIASIEYPTDPKSQDLAILHLMDEVPNYFPLFASDEDPEKYDLLGYIEGDTSKIASAYKLDFRERKDVQYEDYRLPVAIEMVGDPVGGGLSGSPLINPDNNCVCAIFCGGNTVLERAWALPLSETLNWPTFRTLYDHNDHALAKFHSALNKRGAFEVCSRKTQHTLKYYLSASKYVASLHVERTNLSENLEAFCKSGKTLFALVGDANVGKSWALCDFVEQCHTRYPTLLVNAAFETFHKLNMEPEEFCDQLLSGQNQPGDSEMPFAELSSLCLKNHLPVLIILDGINEVDNFNHFMSHWLPTLVAWCNRNSVKLVLSCRSEKWIAVSSRLSSMRSEIYHIDRIVKTEQGTTTEKTDHFLLQEFSIDEANLAVKRYGLQQQQLLKLGRHPLSFKIARSIDVTAISEQLSKYGMIHAFIEHQLNDAAAALSIQNYHPLWSQIKQIANSASANTGGLIEWPDALQLLDQATLQALIDCGLLVSDKQALKFAYDEVSDILQDVQQNSLQQLQTPLSEEELEFDQNGLYHAILHYEYTKNESAFSEHVSALCTKLTAIGEITQVTFEKFDHRIRYNHIYPVLALTIRLTKSLPASRQEVLKTLLAALCNTADIWYLLRRKVQHLAQLVVDSCVDKEFQMTQLLELLHLDDSWPLRMKDWQEPNRRSSFAPTVLDSDLYVASAIATLYEEDPPAVRPLLIKALSDTTRLLSEHEFDRGKKIGRGEATVNSACAGILYCCARNDDETLMVELLQIDTDASSSLIRALAEDNPNAVAASLIKCLKQATPPAEYVLSMISSCIHRFDDSHKQAIYGLYDKLRASLASDEDKTAVLSVLRKSDPTNSDYWNELFDITWRMQGHYVAYQLIPIPDDCFGRLNELVDGSPSLLCKVLESSVQNGIGESPELVKLAVKISNNHDFVSSNALDIGRLIEEVLWKSLDNKTLFDLWADVIFSAVRNAKKGVTLTCINYAIFDDVNRYKAFEAVVDVLITNPIFVECLGTVFDKICVRFDVQNDMDVYRKFRELDKDEFDKALLFKNLNCSDEKALLIIQFWQTYSSQHQSNLSQRIVDMHNDPTFTDNPFSFDSFELLRREW